MVLVATIVVIMAVVALAMRCYRWYHNARRERCFSYMLACHGLVSNYEVVFDNTVPKLITHVRRRCQRCFVTTLPESYIKKILNEPAQCPNAVTIRYIAKRVLSYRGGSEPLYQSEPSA